MTSESAPRAVVSGAFEKDLLMESRSLPLAVLTRRPGGIFFRRPGGFRRNFTPYQAST